MFHSADSGSLKPCGYLRQRRTVDHHFGRIATYAANRAVSNFPSRITNPADRRHGKFEFVGDGLDRHEFDSTLLRHCSDCGGLPYRRRRPSSQRPAAGFCAGPLTDDAVTITASPPMVLKRAPDSSSTTSRSLAQRRRLSASPSARLPIPPKSASSARTCSTASLGSSAGCISSDPADRNHRVVSSKNSTPSAR